MTTSDPGPDYTSVRKGGDQPTTSGEMTESGPIRPRAVGHATHDGARPGPKRDETLNVASVPPIHYSHPKNRLTSQPTRKGKAMTELIVRIQNTLASKEDERGAAMAEYGLLLALVALAAIAILVLFGQSLVDVFTTANTTLQDNLPAGTGTGT